MKIMINHSSMQPIYEQIMDQVKRQILMGEAAEGEALPSVRVGASDQRLNGQKGIRPAGGGRPDRHGARQGELYPGCERLADGRGGQAGDGALHGTGGEKGKSLRHERRGTA